MEIQLKNIGMITVMDYIKESLPWRVHHKKGITVTAGSTKLALRRVFSTLHIGLFLPKVDKNIDDNSANNEFWEVEIGGEYDLTGRFCLKCSKLLQSLNIQSRDYDFAYCVAYKRCIEPRDRYKYGVEKEKVLFGLESYKNTGFVKEVFTQNVDYFTKEFKKQFQKELAC